MLSELEIKFLDGTPSIATFVVDQVLNISNLSHVYAGFFKPPLHRPLPPKCVLKYPKPGSIGVLERELMLNLLLPPPMRISAEPVEVRIPGNQAVSGLIMDQCIPLREYAKSAVGNLDECAGILYDACINFARFHALGIVFQDIAMDNLVVQRRTRDDVNFRDFTAPIDFGSFLINPSLSPPSPITISSSATTLPPHLGTLASGARPAYWSPEEEKCKSTCPSFITDVYRLGLVAAEMLIGNTKNPKEALSKFNELYKKMEDHPYIKVIKICTQSDPTERYPNFMELLEDFYNSYNRYKRILSPEPIAPYQLEKMEGEISTLPPDSFFYVGNTIFSAILLLNWGKVGPAEELLNKITNNGKIFQTTIWYTIWRLVFDAHKSYKASAFIHSDHLLSLNWHPEIVGIIERGFNKIGKLPPLDICYSMLTEVQAWLSTFI
jgi:hypothetical protein